MKILVDGDACPGRHIIERIAKKYDIKVIIYCDINHDIESDYSEVLRVDAGFQSVDMYLINKTEKDDIVITQDFGVAAMALSRKAKALSPKGNEFSNENIDRLLFERHLSSKARRGGKRTGTIKKRTSKDDDKLQRTLEKMILDYKMK